MGDMIHQTNTCHGALLRKTREIRLIKNKFLDVGCWIYQKYGTKRDFHRRQRFDRLPLFRMSVR